MKREVLEGEKAEEAKMIAKAANKALRAKSVSNEMAPVTSGGTADGAPTPGSDAVGARSTRMRPTALILVCIAAGCAPPLLAVKGKSSRDGVAVEFCGSEAQKEHTSSSMWMPGRGFGWGSSTSETGETAVCLTISNESDGVLVIDRKHIKLQGDGYRGVPLGDGQERRWTIKSGGEESLTLTYDTSSLSKGDDVVVAFKGALILDGAPLKLSPLRLAYK